MQRLMLIKPVKLNTKKIENILPNETQSANTIINSKMTTTSNFCLDDSNSEPSIYQYSSSSYVPSTTFSDHSSNYSEPDILIPNQNITPIRHIIHLDKNVVVNPNNNITLPQNNASSLNIDNYILQSLENKNNKKLKHRTICKFCKNNVTNFERHLERQHSNKPEVIELLGFSKSSKGKAERKKIIALLRYETQFRKFVETGNSNKLPCIYCKRLVKASYLRRHYKVCVVKPINKSNQKIQHQAQSQTLLACAADTENTAAAIQLKNEVFLRIRADDIALIAKKDDLIRRYGENYSKRHKREQIVVPCSNKIRECAKLLKVTRRRTNNNKLTFFDIISTCYYDIIAASAKTISRYDDTLKEYLAPSLAIHLGITPISSDLINSLEGNRFHDNSNEAAVREASWKTIKYTLLFLGFAFIGTASYIIFDFGKPVIGRDGKVIPDEFSNQPTFMQYIYRTLREFEYYKRLIREPSRDKLLPDELKPPYYQPPYTLVLELIDVLVHPDWTYNTGWRFKKRPGVDYFLETLSSFYEIVIYTAEQGMTVFPIVEALDPKNLIMYKLVRDATHFVDGHHVKNLDKLNRNLNKIVVVDWNMNSVKFHPENVFRIPKWDGNDNDTALIDLTALLLTVANSEVKDVREVLTYYNSFEDGLTTFREKQRMIIEQQESQKKHEPVNPAQILSKTFFIKSGKL
ncbi:hypothetical protein RN001_005498 [Aquatica leii]|uniref:FCP1 homology domain-containing protein n=1 Tax=Aquatica leii TaxID=1421715 RepID=A0AAN7SIX5_9COLE|nr:hypothetical protein RN001_005498 [Aquatica leii]